jgi:hypothetical protein
MPFLWDYTIKLNSRNQVARTYRFFSHYQKNHKKFYKNFKLFRVYLNKYLNKLTAFEPNMIIIMRPFFHRLNFKTNYRIRFFTTFIKRHVAEKLTFFTNHYDYEYKKKNKKKIFYKDLITTTPYWLKRIVNYKLCRRRRKIWRRKVFKKSLHYSKNLPISSVILTKTVFKKIDPRVVNVALFFNNLLSKDINLILIFKKFSGNFFKIFHFFYNRIRNKRPMKNFSEFEFALKISFLI